MSRYITWSDNEKSCRLSQGEDRITRVYFTLAGAVLLWWLNWRKMFFGLTKDPEIYLCWNDSPAKEGLLVYTAKRHWAVKDCLALKEIYCTLWYLGRLVDFYWHTILLDNFRGRLSKAILVMDWPRLSVGEQGQIEADRKRGRVRRKNQQPFKNSTAYLVRSPCSRSLLRITNGDR